MPGITSISRATDDNKTIINAISLTGKVNSIEVDMSPVEFLEAFHRWNNRENRVLIQDAFPKLDKNQREFILSGTTKEEWEEMFPKDGKDE